MVRRHSHLFDLGTRGWEAHAFLCLEEGAEPHPGFSAFTSSQSAAKCCKTKSWRSGWRQITYMFWHKITYCKTSLFSCFDWLDEDKKWFFHNHEQCSARRERKEASKKKWSFEWTQSFTVLTSWHSLSLKCTAWCSEIGSLTLRDACNGAYANMAAKYGGQCKRPPRDGNSPFLTCINFKGKWTPAPFLLRNSAWALHSGASSDASEPISLYQAVRFSEDGELEHQSHTLKLRLSACKVINTMRCTSQQNCAEPVRRNAIKSLISAVLLLPPVVRAWLKWISAFLSFSEPGWFALYFASFSPSFVISFLSVLRCVSSLSTISTSWFAIEKLSASLFLAPSFF